MMLGRYLARGLAGQQDPGEARLWLEKALAQGLKDVQGDLASLPSPALAVAPASSPEARAAARYGTS